MITIMELTDINYLPIINDVIRLLLQGYDERAFGCIEPLTPQSVREYWSRLRPYNYEILGLLNMNNLKLTGFIDFTVELSRGEILGVIIDVPYRGRGLGRLLVSVAEYRMIDYGANIIYTRINKDNIRSKHFFRSLGYRPTGKLIFTRDSCGYWWEEEIWIKYL